MPWELPVFTLVLLLHLISEASSRPEVLKMVVLCTQNLFVLFPTAWPGYKVFFLYKVFFSPSISDLPGDSLAIVGDLHEARTGEFSVLVPHHLINEMCLLSSGLY